MRVAFYIIYIYINIYISSFYSYFNDPSLTHCRQDQDVLIPIDDRHRSSPRPRTPLIKQMAEEIRNLRSKAPHLGTNGPEMVQKDTGSGSDEYCGSIFASLQVCIRLQSITCIQETGTWCLSPFVQVKQLEMETWLKNSHFQVGKLQSKDWVKSETGSLYVLMGIKWRSGGVVQTLFRTKSTAPIFGFDDREFVNISWWSTEARG